MTVVLTSGESLAMTDDQGQRVLYALTSLAATPIGLHLNVERVTANAGETLWLRPTAEAA